ncbi:synapse-associated protein 1-like isoform X2 [Gigantopelta aegis]|uniref:synapse-associated protein 1-like isoform X2 n=1 Tax=Gigantopelta aegis TaxID=1735272 RepID=UPI001B88B843|nr:synapse-associated protein 1-like isoform X2 [Gigantopelta aegis]
MFSTVTSWLGVGEKGDLDMPPDDAKENKQVEKNEGKEVPNPETDNSEIKSDTDTHTVTDTDEKVTAENENDISAKQALEDVSAKALSTAKEWGSFLYSFGKAAGKTVADTAKQLKTSVEEKTLLGHFAKEQDKFVAEHQEKTKHQEAAVPPWVGYNEEEVMKSQILALSQDKRNFVRNPPSGVQFQFDFNALEPVAMATLQEDPNLQKMRFELVPKQVKEDVFWKNYFYRVSLIKQSTQLTSLAQTTGSTGENRSSGSSRRSSTGSENKADTTNAQKIEKSSKEDELAVGSPPQDNEFISDTFAGSAISEDDIRKEIEQLRVTGDNKDSNEGDVALDDVAQWEKDLQQELQEYEMVCEGVDVNDDDLEREILQQIEDEASLS